MIVFRRIILATVAFLSTAVPVSAQTVVAETSEQHGSLLWVWAWILIVGISVFIIGTSLGVGRRR